jgi:hypothetical protein
VKQHTQTDVVRRTTLMLTLNKTAQHVDAGHLTQPFANAWSAPTGGSLSAAALGRVIYDIWIQGHRTSLLSQRREIRRLEAERERAQYESLVLRHLEYLSREEIKCIADALRKKEQSFFASVRSPLASNLMAKGLVWTPGGAHNQDLCPFLFVDFAWDALLRAEWSS